VVALQATDDADGGEQQQADEMAAEAAAAIAT